MDSVSLWLPAAENTAFSGGSLASTLYGLPLDIHLVGELGAGKTHFLRGFATALGVKETLTSPTYALEQRYRTADGMHFIHIDCHRLNAGDARSLLAATDDHDGIRAIEWADRLEDPTGHPTIRIRLKEKDAGRELSCTFDDIPLPSRDAIQEWRKEVMLPEHIQHHCDAVANFCEALSDALLRRGILLRPLALRRAAEAHDLFRFIDFRPGASGPFSNVYPKDQQALFDFWKNHFAGWKHESACASFLRERGYEALGMMVATHGLSMIGHSAIKTMEQKLLFYADKRIRHDQVVTLQERFEDFCKRYADGRDSEQSRFWHDEVRALEVELFPEGAPLV